MRFSFGWIAQILIWAVALGAAFLILKAILAFALPKIGIPMVAEVVTLLVSIIKIIIVALVVIVVIIFAFDAIACLIGMAGGLPSLRH